MPICLVPRPPQWKKTTRGPATRGCAIESQSTSLRSQTQYTRMHEGLTHQLVWIRRSLLCEAICVAHDKRVVERRVESPQRAIASRRGKVRASTPRNHATPPTTASNHVGQTFTHISAPPHSRSLPLCFSCSSRLFSLSHMCARQTRVVWHDDEPVMHWTDHGAAAIHAIHGSGAPLAPSADATRCNTRHRRCRRFVRTNAASHGSSGSSLRRGQGGSASRQCGEEPRRAAAGRSEEGSCCRRLGDDIRAGPASLVGRLDFSLSSRLDSRWPPLPRRSLSSGVWRRACLRSLQISRHFDLLQRPRTSPTLTM